MLYFELFDAGRNRFAGQVHEDIFLMFTQIDSFPPVILREPSTKKI